MSDLHGTPAHFRFGAVVALPQAVDRFILTSRDISADAERIEIALTARDITPERRPARRSNVVAPAPALLWHRPGRADVVLNDMKVTLEFLDEILPDQPLHPADPEMRAIHRAMIDLGVRAQHRLEAVIHTRHQVQYDIAVHHLRQVLTKAERAVGDHGFGRAQPLSNADAVFAPTLWRLQLLDREWRSFLLHGLPLLAGWAEALEEKPAVAQILTPSRGRDFLGNLSRDRAFVTGSDHASGWDSILRFSKALGAG